MNFFNCCLRREDTQPDPPNQDILHSAENFAYCQMGYGKGKIECQEYYLGEDNFRVYGIFDGHGQNGKKACEDTYDNFIIYFEKYHKSRVKNNKRQCYLKDAFKYAEKKLKESGFDYSKSGTCGICAMIFQSTIIMSNLGNSAAGLYRQNENQGQFIPLSIDHNVKNKQEKLRIRQIGGQIKRKKCEDEIKNDRRVWINEEGPGVKFTRSLGDFAYKKYLISEPEIKQYELTKDDKFMVLASDGVWDVMTLQEVCEFILKQEQKEQSAELLVQECRRRWDEINEDAQQVTRVGDDPNMKNCCDDITAIIVYFKFMNNE